MAGSSTADASIVPLMEKDAMSGNPARKPAAVIGTSPGAIGTAVAQQSLRSVLGFLNAPRMNTVEAYIQFTPGMITDDGEVMVESTEAFLRNDMAEFHAHIAWVLTVLPREDWLERPFGNGGD